MPKYSKEEAQLMKKMLAIPGLIEKASNLLKEEEFSPVLYNKMDKHEISKIIYKKFYDLHKLFLVNNLTNEDSNTYIGLFLKILYEKNSLNPIDKLFKDYNYSPDNISVDEQVETICNIKKDEELLKKLMHIAENSSFETIPEKLFLAITIAGYTNDQALFIIDTMLMEPKV